MCGLSKLPAVMLLAAAIPPAWTDRAGEAQRARIDALIRQLADHSYALRTRATAELAAIGPAAAPRIVRSLEQTRDLEVRFRLKSILRSPRPDWGLWRAFAGPPPRRLRRSPRGRIEWVGLLGDGRLRPAGEVTAHSTFPGGRLAATGGRSGLVRVWDLHTGAQRNELRAGHAPVRTIAASEDGRWLAACVERAITVWNLASGKATIKLAAAEPVRELRFRSAGKRLLSVDRTGLVCEWDRATGNPLREMRVTKDEWAINALALGSTDGSCAVALKSGGLQIWRLGTSNPDLEC